MRASAEHDTVALVMLDLDDFKKVNDVYGHGVGDQLLRQVADVLRATVRSSDVVSRIGGEEFAIIVPSGDLRSSVALAERIASELGRLEAEAAGRLTVSTGVAIGPEHAANPRELVACAEAAMMTAKTRGKGLILPFDASDLERPSEENARRRDDVRSIAHLKMLQSLSGKLSRLNDVARIGLTIADELRLLIDYHNCRVFLRDGEDLLPIAFRGDLLSAEPLQPVELLPTRVGRGVTGRVAATGQALLIGDAARHEFGEQIPGTAQIEESLLAVPLTFGARVTGVIVVSKLGLGQFDSDDLRVLEVLAGHASVALENARLYEAQRREAESATALLEFTREVSEATGIGEVAERVAQGSARILSSPSTSLWLQDAVTGDLVKLASHSSSPAEAGPGERRFPARCSRRGSTAPSRTTSTRRTMQPSRHRRRTRTAASRSPRSRSTAAGASSRLQYRRRACSATATSSCSRGSRSRRSSHCGARRATRRSSARSSPRSRRSRTRSRRTTSTRRSMRAGSRISR